MMFTAKRMAWAALAVLGACLLASPGLADEQKKAKGEALSDAEFVMKVSQDGMAEVNHGRAAVQKATRPEVKQFAQRMITDHTKSNQELLTLANQKGLTAARDMGPKHTKMAEKMAQMQGEDFDRHYMQHMLEDHQKAVSLFESQAKNAKDPDVRAFAEKTLPTLREHLKVAKEIAGKTKGGTER